MNVLDSWHATVIKNMARENFLISYFLIKLA